jgi:hypothetical protein
MRAFATDAMGSAGVGSPVAAATFWPRSALVPLQDPQTVDEFNALGIEVADHAWPMQEGALATYAYDKLGSLHLLQDTETSGDKPVAGQPAVGLWWNDSLIGRRAWETRHLKDQLNSGDSSTFELDKAWSIYVRFKFAFPAASSAGIMGNRSATGTNAGWTLRISSGVMYIVVDDSVAGVQTSSLTGTTTYDDQAWHDVLICHDGAGSFYITTDMGSVTPSTMTVSGATGGEEFVIGAPHAESTAVGLQFSGAMAWERDIRATADDVRAALFTHGQFPELAGIDSAALSKLTRSTNSYCAGVDSVFGEFMATYGGAQCAVFYDQTADVDAGAEDYGVIIAAVTNLCTNSENLTTSWSAVGTGYSFDALAGTAPNGHIRADYFAQGLGTDYVESGSTTVSASTDYCQSIYLAANGTATLVKLEFLNGAGTVMATKQVIVDGWSRVFITGQSTDTGAKLRITPQAGGTELFMFGYQVESGLFMKLYVGTYGSTAGYSQQRYRYDHDPGDISTVKGSIVAEITAFSSTHSSDRNICDLDDGNASLENKLVVYSPSSQQGFQFFLYDSSEVLIAEQATSGGLVQPLKFICAWDSVLNLAQHGGNNFAMRQVDGISDLRESSEDADGTVTETNTRLSVGSTAGGASNLIQGMIRKLQIFAQPFDLGDFGE